MWQIKRRGVMILIVSFVLAICLGSIGLLGKFWMIIAVLLLMGLTAGMANVHLVAWIMQRIDVTVRGRVSSVLMLSSVGLMPVSLAVAGLLTAWNVKLMYLCASGVMLLITTLRPCKSRCARSCRPSELVPKSHQLPTVPSPGRGDLRRKSLA
jgi:MFS family permease